jgi:hypothetical protein
VELLVLRKVPPSHSPDSVHQLYHSHGFIIGFFMQDCKK